MLEQLIKYNTVNSSGSSYSSFIALINSIYVNGFLLGMKFANTNNYNRNIRISNSDIILEVVNMQEDVRYIRDKLDKICDKFDGDFNDVKSAISTIQVQMGKTDVKIDNLIDKVKNIKNNSEKSKGFWKQYIIAPVSTSIITGIILSIFIYFFKLK